jgi:ribonuclease PH
MCSMPTVGIVAGVPCLDLNYEEDKTAHVDMNVVKTSAGKFIEVQGTAEAEPFGSDELTSMLSLADFGIRELLEAQKKALAL